MRNGLHTFGNGSKAWFKDNQYHREDGPAIEHGNGTKFWHQNGKRHREDGPAVEWADGIKEWYYKDIFVGKGDRPNPTLWARLTSVELNGGSLLNGCVVDLFGDKRWFKDGLRHRVDGPAVEEADGTKSWCFNDDRLDTGTEGFWKLWELLTDEQRGNPTLLRYLPR